MVATLHPIRFRTVSPRPSRSSPSASASVSPPPPSRASPRRSLAKPRSSGESKENVEPLPVQMYGYAEMSASRLSKKANGKLPVSEEKEMGNGGGRAWRDGSRELSDDTDGVPRPRRTRPTKSPAYDGLPTLSTIPDSEDEASSSTSNSNNNAKPPPPAQSAAMAKNTPERPVTRKRRSSSIKRKPSPAVKPMKVVDWEIPRKTLHSSIGIVTLLLNYLDPPTIRPLLIVLSSMLVAVLTADFFRLNFPTFAESWELYFRFLMRESERGKINGVVWYLVGVITVLGLYPRDVAVVSVLTLAWSDTTASTIGRLWGRHTPPLPSNFPGIRALRFAPRKSLAGFLAATFTGMMICIGFWWNGSAGRWSVLNGHAGLGLWLTAVVVGLGGAVAEALDLGLDDNLTLPILSGTIVWIWLGLTNIIL